jgi:predicted heme/steroid binding protein
MLFLWFGDLAIKGERGERKIIYFKGTVYDRSNLEILPKKGERGERKIVYFKGTVYDRC